jgi:mannose/cellobiose epimerase-like protein (N-acyl-D-glucosamine 2-epimerase family)
MKTYYAIQICTLTLLSSFALQTVEAQVNVQSKYLQNPELGIELADSSAKFWFDSFDEQEGAFFTNVARNGEPSDDEKQMITQSQNAYGMARAFQLTGDTTYLNYGRRALDWMYENSWDEEHGGWLKDSDQKYAFDQHYALIGPSAMFEAGNDSLDWKWLMKGYESNQNL